MLDVVKKLLSTENPPNICFMCFKENENNISVDDIMEIYDENSNSTTTLRNISKYLFSFYDIIARQACEICTKLIIEMYTTINRGLMKIKLIQKFTEKIHNELESNSVLLMNKMTINLQDEKTSEDLNNRGIVGNKNAGADDVSGLLITGSTAVKPHLEYAKGTQSRKIKISNAKNQTRKHIKPTKTNENYIKCKDCEYKTSNKQDLESHTNKAHLNVRPYICKSCQKGFFSYKNLKEHCLTHQNNIDVMVCDVCGECFCYRKTLEIHLRTHENIKPYNCGTCGHRFVTISQRNEHVKRKHGSKEFNCNLCVKKYALPKDLRRHKKNMHQKVI